MDTRVYVMTHKQFTPPDDPLYIPLHVGRSLGEDLGFQGDHTGDSISEKNRNYCELTGIYWLWKNITCDIVGVCHYRRYFAKEDRLISKQNIEDILQKQDVIVSNSEFTKYSSLREHYANIHQWKDMELCRTVISERCPQYLQAFDLCMSCNFFSLGNMIITRKKIFDRYCEWLFDILFEVERRIDLTGYDTFQARIYGYLSERLLRVWLLQQKLSIQELPVFTMDPTDFDHACRKLSMIQRVVELSVPDTLAKYQLPHVQSPICSEPHDIDFRGKLPVWLCWWQGYESAPEVVKLCIDSVRRNMPRKSTEVILITIDNVDQYVEFPKWIIQRFEQGAISLGHMSDILQAGLLYRYGGLWMDVSYYMMNPLPEQWIRNGGLLTVREQPSDFKPDIVRGRWNWRLIKTEPKDMLIGFLLDAMYEYWQMQEKLIDAHMVDDLIALAYERIDAIREILEGYPNVICRIDNQTLIGCMNCRYDETLWNQMIKNAELFRLPYHTQVVSENILHQQTTFGFMEEMQKLNQE